jgi:hypothetical protein
MLVPNLSGIVLDFIGQDFLLGFDLFVMLIQSGLGVHPKFRKGFGVV